jgi:hypothetical protein
MNKSIAAAAFTAAPELLFNRWIHTAADRPLTIAWVCALASIVLNTRAPSRARRASLADDITGTNTDVISTMIMITTSISIIVNADRRPFGNRMAERTAATLDARSCGAEDADARNLKRPAARIEMGC